MRPFLMRHFNRLLIVRNFKKDYLNLDIAFGHMDIPDDWNCYFQILYKKAFFSNQENSLLEKMIRIFDDCHNFEKNYFSKKGLKEFKDCKNKFLSLSSIQKDLEFIEEQKKKYGEKWPQVLLEEVRENDKKESKKFWEFWEFWKK